MQDDLAARLDKLADSLASIARDWNKATAEDDTDVAAATVSAARDVRAAASRMRALEAALEIIRRLLNNEGGVDMTNEQIVSAINGAITNAD